MQDDIEARLRHCSENTKDEYLHELAGRSADTIASLRAEVARLRGAMDAQTDECICPKCGIRHGGRHVADAGF